MPIIILIALLISAPVLAICPTTPILETFVCITREQYQDLILLGEIEILLEMPVPETENRAAEIKRIIKPLLNKAKNSVFFNTKAGDALNEFYLYWMTIIDDAQPYHNETLESYHRRATERAFYLQERANRLRIITE